MKKKQFIATIISCVLVLAAAAAGILSSGILYYEEDYGYSEEYVAVIPIYDTIGSPTTDYFGNYTSLTTGDISSYIDELKMDDFNKGICLVIDSPGGAVYDSDKIYQCLMEYKAETGRPIEAVCMSQMCSGAYYIASAADYITAERTADVGSIGVYIEQVDVSGLLDKLGVSVTYIRSSENKAMGNMYNEMTEEQTAIYQSIIEEHYERFLDIVQESRGYDRDTLRAIADGRTYTATQALENGLIDEIIEWDDELDVFKALLGVEGEEWLTVESVSGLESLLSGVLQALPASETDEVEKLMNTRNGVAMYYAG